MKIKTVLAFFLVPLWIVSVLNSQDLVELSKKEKERRAAAKKTGVVVTNADLGKVKKKEALIVGPSESADQKAPINNTENITEDLPPAEENISAPQQEPPLEEPGISPDQDSSLSDREFQRQKAEFESKWNSAQERVDLLTMKMNALWQEFYNMSDMTSRDAVQLQISETYSKLLQAQEEATKAKEELDNFIATTQREGVPAIWIH